MGTVKDLLIDLGVVAEHSISLYSIGTRDQPELRVFKDQTSEVIFIDDYYVGDAEYQVGDHRSVVNSKVGGTDLERSNDTSRRLRESAPYIYQKRILDFGCGLGDFIIEAKKKARSATGVELDLGCRTNISEQGVKAVESLSEVSDESLDTVFCFHVLEHLPDPADTLQEMFAKLTPGGTLVVEVPHARDFLLSVADSAEYKSFTLWSQHLILHTRESLERLLKSCGFAGILISGVQRYSLGNHFGWLINGRPGGHKSTLASIETSEVRSAYSAALAMLDRTDTLFAVCSKPK
jgi:SAM-dependent methyltransferase